MTVGESTVLMFSIRSSISTAWSIDCEKRTVARVRGCVQPAVHVLATAQKAAAGMSLVRHV